jgi:hypothetical protein
MENRSKFLFANSKLVSSLRTRALRSSFPGMAGLDALKKFASWRTRDDSVRILPDSPGPFASGVSRNPKHPVGR